VRSVCFWVFPHYSFCFVGNGISIIVDGVVVGGGAVIASGTVAQRLVTVCIL
jgi:acetyltransferase-like isoleucine patch superfamily enzyme